MPEGATADPSTATPWALVTGGSSGIGLGLAGALHGRGLNLVILGRDTSRLNQAAAQLGNQRVETLALDVTDRPAVMAAMAALLARLGAPLWVVTSAGMAKPGRFLDQALVDHDAQWAANYLGTLNIVHALAPAMARAGQGRVVLISSAAALGGFYGYGAYAPSKWAVRGLGEVLALELGAHGIQVTTAFPPDTQTPQLEAERLTRPALTARFAAGNPVLRVDAVVRAILRAADRGRPQVAPGAELLLFVGPLMARYLTWCQRRLMRHVPEAAPPAGPVLP